MKLIKKLNITSALFIVLCSFGLSTLLSRDINNSLFGSIERNEGFFSFCYLFVFYLALISLKNPKYWKRLFVFIAVLGVIMSCIGVWQFVCGTENLTFDVARCTWDAYGTRADMTIGNPAFAAGWLILSMVFTVLAIILVDKKWLFYLIPAGLLQLFVLYLCKVRGAWLSVLVASLLYLILRKFDKKK